MRNLKLTAFRAKPETLELLTEEANRRDMSRSELIRHAIHQLLGGEGSEEETRGPEQEQVLSEDDFEWDADGQHCVYKGRRYKVNHRPFIQQGPHWSPTRLYLPEFDGHS